MERIERVVTSGTFSLDGGCWDVDNNVWIIGNDSSVIIIDPAHDVDKISRTVAGRTVEKILLTHAHDDHIRSAKEAAERFGAPVYLNPADRVLWEMVYPSWDFDHELADGDVLRIGDTELKVLATGQRRRLTRLARPGVGNLQVQAAAGTATLRTVIAEHHAVAALTHAIQVQ